MDVPSDTLTSFVPASVVRRFLRSRSVPERPEAERVPAAVLFADISGFTPLAERLASLGPIGAERLTALLNAYFGRLIQVVSAHGGEVIKFAGDALLALWPAGREGLPPATLAACRCGLAVRDALAGFAHEAESPLLLRIAVACGETFLLQVGGTGGRWEIVVAGKPLNSMAAAGREARPGEVVLSAEAWSIASPHCLGTPRGGGCVRLDHVRAAGLVRAAETPAPLPAGPGIAAFVPAAVTERLAAGQSEWLSELRRVTVLFVNLPDPCAAEVRDAEPAGGEPSGLPGPAAVADDGPVQAPSVRDALVRTQSPFQAVQEAVQRHEGTINKLAVDDKGLFVLAAFGLPPLAHQDDPERGVLAAMAVRSALSDIGVQCGIGVATGTVFCGVVGSPLRREYTVIGDAVNLAARLMQRAGDSILCDEPTAAAAEGKIDFDARNAIAVKGKAELIPTFTPRGRTARAASAAPLVGRTRERAALEAHLAALRQGTSASVLIEGPPGSGKTRLLELLVEEADAAGVPCLVAAADAVVQSAPYHAWRPVFERLLGLDQVVPPDRRSRTAHVLRRLADDPLFQRLGPLLREVADVDLPDNDLTAAMAGEVRAHNTQDLLVHLLSKPPAPGQSPVPRLLLVEDAQWLDSASWALLRLVCTCPAPLLVVVAARPSGDRHAPELATFEAMPGVTALLLSPLTLEDTAKLVRLRIGVPARDDVVRMVHERAEGNPFFAGELVLALHEAGAAVVKEGELHLSETGIKAFSLPDTVQGTVLARLDRLDARQQLIIKVASVIGKTFGYTLLSNVYPVDADRPVLADKLADLVRIELVILHSQDPERTYLHRHETAREVAYGLLLYEQRRKLHRAVAEALEAVGPGAQAPPYARLAYHWARAEVADRTLFYLEKAGEQALLEGAYREAAECFKEALHLASDPQQRSRLLRMQGEAQLGLGDLPASRASLEQSVALLGFPVPAKRPGLLWGLLRAVARQVRNRFLPTRPAQDAAARCLALEVARVHLRLLETYFFLAGPAEAFYAALVALNSAEKVGPSPELARANALIGWLVSLVPAFRLADRYLARADALATSDQGRAALQPVRFFSGFCRVAEGRFAEGRQSLEEAVRLAEHIGDKRRWIEAVCGLSTLLHYQGQYERRVQMGADVLYASARRQGDLQAEAWGLLDQAESLVIMGEQKRAVEVLTATAPFLEKDIGKSELVWGHGLTAMAQLRAGNVRKAMEEAAAAVDAAAAVAPVAVYCFEGYAGAADVLLALCEASRGSSCDNGTWSGVNTAGLQADPRHLRGLAKRACKLLASYARVFPIARPRALLCLGRLANLSGKRPRSRKLWCRGLDEAIRLKLPYDEARLREVLCEP